MILAFYMDHHVPAAVTEGLRRRGIDVLTAAEDFANLYEDADLLARATSLGRVLYSQDKDLLRITTEWQRIRREFAGLAYGHQMEVSIGQAIEDLEIIVRASSDDEMKNRVEFLPL